MITMGQLRKLLNVTLDNIQLSGGKLHKFLISDSGEDPVTKVILEYGPHVDSGQCGLHSAVTINLLEMTLECIEDSGGQLLTFLIEDKDNLMKVILEFKPTSGARHKSHDKRRPLSPQSVIDDGFKTYPPAQGQAEQDIQHGQKQYSMQCNRAGGKVTEGYAGQRRHSIASSGVSSDRESSIEPEYATVREKHKAKPATTTTSQTPDGNAKSPQHKRDSHSIKDRNLADKTVSNALSSSTSKGGGKGGGGGSKAAKPPSLNFSAVQCRPDLVSTGVIAKDKAKSGSVEELLTLNSSSLNNNTLKQRPPSTKLLPDDFEAAPLVKFSEGDIKLSSSGKSAPLSPSSAPRPLPSKVTTADTQHIKDTDKSAKSKQAHIGNGSTSSPSATSNKVGSNGAAKKLTGNGQAAKPLSAPQEDDLKLEAKDTVSPLPVIDKQPTSPPHRKNRHHQHHSHHNRKNPGILKGSRKSATGHSTQKKSIKLQREDDSEDDFDDDIDSLDEDDDSDDSVELISDIKTSKPQHKRGVLVRRSTMFF